MKNTICEKLMWSAMTPAVFQYIFDHCKNTDVSEVKKKSWKHFKDMLSRTPDIGGFTKNPLRICLSGGMIWMAVYKAMDGNMSHEQFGEMVTAAMQAPLIKKAFRSKNPFDMEYQKRKVEKDKIANSISDSEFNWMTETIPGRDADEYITNYHRCGLCALGKQEHLEELIPYMCAMDFISVDLMGGVLYRTGTLAEGAEMCDFYICKKDSKWDKERRRQLMSERKEICLGTHGENYGNWMSDPVFYMAGGLTALTVLLAVLSFAVFSASIPGILFGIIAAGLLMLLVWITWIRRQYAFDGGSIMERVHQTILSYIGYDGKGTLLDVGCGSGALSIRAALTWQDTKVIGIDYWASVYNYSQGLCEKNAVSEGAGSQCVFQHGDANHLDFPNESFDAVVSNYVYHNITGADKQQLLLETLRVLKKGGVFALNDDMKPRMYGDMEAFAQKLRDMGYEEVRLIDTAQEVFGSHRRAAMMMLGESRMLVGRK